MRNGFHADASEPALVTALVAPLVKLRAALGDGTRPDDTTLSAMSAVPVAVRASDDTHRGGLTPLAATETAAAAVPVLEKTGGEVAALSDVAPAFAPLLTSAYGVRDKAATALDSLISNFRAQATPLVNSARSQADLDAVVTLAADHLQGGVGVVKAADGEMDALTSRLAQDQPQVTTPGTTPGQPGLAVPASGQPGLAVPADEQNPVLVAAHPKSSTTPDSTITPDSSTVPDSSVTPADATPAETDPQDAATDSGPDATTPPAQTDPLLAAQQAIQNALSSATQAITTGIQQAQTALADALAGVTPQQPDGATPAPADTTPLPDQSPTTPPQTTPPHAGVPDYSALPDQSAAPDPSPVPDSSPAPDPSPVPDHSGAPVPPITADPKPGNDIQHPRDGQAGVTSIPAPAPPRDGQAGVTPISPAPTGRPRDGQAGVTSPPNTP